MTRELRAVLVGFGVWGKRLFEKCDALDGVDIVGVADPASIDHTIGVRRVPRFADFEPLADEMKPDVVLVAVSPSVQGRVALESIRRGFPTFIEKPMAMDVETALLIAEAAKVRGTTVGVGHVVRYERGFEIARRWVSEGAIGELLSMVAHRIGARPRPDANPLWVLGPHEFSRFFALVSGSPHFSFARASAEEAHAHFSLAGVSCEIHLGQGPPRRRLLVLEGTRGRIEFDEGSGRVFLERKGGPSRVFEERGDPLLEELDDFFRAVRSGGQPRTSVEEGLEVVKALDALERFARRSRSSELEAYALARVE